MPVCEDVDLALIGWSVINEDTKHHPKATLKWGLLMTIDTMGAGTSGMRFIPRQTIPQEWVFQQALMTNGTLLTRFRINTAPFTARVKRW